MKLSVIIPAHNAEAHIAEAIASVLTQSVMPLEIVLVDNRCTDGTVAAAKECSPLVRIVRESTPGAAHARNAGVREAAGDVLAFLDADDLWTSNCLPIRLRELEGADIVLGRMRNFYSSEVTEPESARIPVSLEPADAFNPSAMLVRRAAFDCVGPFPPIRSGEFIAWIGMAKSLGLTIRSVPEVVALRRIHANNSSRRLDPLDYVRAAKLVLDRRRALASDARK